MSTLKSRKHFTVPASTGRRSGPAGKSKIFKEWVPPVVAVADARPDERGSLSVDSPSHGHSIEAGHVPRV
jgi:hypothetical protein